MTPTTYIVQMRKVFVFESNSNSNAHINCNMSSIAVVLKLKNAKLEAQLAEANAATIAMDSRIKELEQQLRDLKESKAELPLTSASRFVPIPRPPA